MIFLLKNKCGYSAKKRRLDKTKSRSKHRPRHQAAPKQAAAKSFFRFRPGSVPVKGGSSKSRRSFAVK
jgi:hypothetical protein